MTSTLQQDVVQGPVEHPRFGKALVVRPTIGTNRANRFPSQAVIVTAVARRLIELSREGERIKSVVVEGDLDDPTKHPDFHEISQNVRELVNKHFPKADLNLVSDIPSLDRPQVRHALCFYDRPFVRLEAGYQKTFAALTGADPKQFKGMVENMGRLESDRLIVQARFVRGAVDNSKANEVNAWIRHLTEIKPATVQISTPSRAKKGTRTKPITKTRMTQIAELVTAKTGIPVEVTG